MPFARPTVRIFNTPVPYPMRPITFRGGLRNNVSAEFIGLDELSVVTNYIPDILSTAEIVKREGITKAFAASLSEVVTRGWEGKNNNYFSTSTAIYALTGGAALDSGLTSATDVSFVTFLDNDIFCNGTEVRTSTNGTTFAGLGGTPPAFRYMASHNNILFGAGHSLGVLRWADAGTAATWSATNSWTITNDENDDIVGLAKFRSVLLVFCENSIHHVTGFTTTDVQLVRSFYGVGCTSNKSIVVTPEFVAWWTRYGLAISLDGTTDNIQFPFRDKIPNTLNGLNKAQYGNIHCTWNPNQQCIHCFVSNGTSSTHDMRIDYYYNERGGTDQSGRSLGTCWIHTGTATQMGGSFLIISSGNPRVYCGSTAANGYLYYVDPDALDDSGAAISANLETGWDATQYGPDSVKRIAMSLLRTNIIGNASVTVGIYIDDEETASIERSIALSASGFVLDVSQLGVGMLGGGNQPRDVPISWKRKFRKIKYRIADSSALRTRLRGITHKGTIISL